MWRGSPAVGRSRLDAKNAACHHCRRETNFGGRIVRLSDNDVMVAATLAAAVGQTMTSKSASDLVSALEEIIEFAQRQTDVWFARRLDIAQWWNERYPPEP